MTNEIPFIAVGNDELGDPIGDTVICSRCSEEHNVEYGINKATGEKSKLFAFVSCGESSYLVAIDGKKII